MTTETTPAPTTADPAREATGYSVKAFIDPAQLKRDLTFSPNNLTGAMMDQASLFAHYGTLAADASRQVDIVELLLQNTEAAVYKLTRDDMVSRGEKPTEAQLGQIISRHPRVVAMKKALNEAKHVESLGKTAVEAFRHRRDMLQQHGWISREEMKGEMSISKKAIHEDTLRAQRENFMASRKANPE
jgi:hypothetical protein